MIAYIKGNVMEENGTFAVLLANGVGYKVFASASTLASLKVGEEGSVYTYLAVRETALDLYGFQNTTEMQFFELLLSVSGIGPKSALGILNVADVETLSSAILNNDSSYLTKVSGVGAKSAKKIVLELQGKIEKIAGDHNNAMRTSDMDVLEALQALGYAPHEVRDVLKELPVDIETTNARIKEALKRLGK